MPCITIKVFVYLFWYGEITDQITPLDQMEHQVKKHVRLYEE